MSDQSSKPTRPSTPSIDAYYALYHGAQNPRYEESENGVVDNGLNAVIGDEKQGVYDQSSVTSADRGAAQQYLDDVEGFIKLHGGFWPVDGSTDHTGQTETGAETSDSTGQQSGAGATEQAALTEQDLQAAVPAPSSEAETHVLVPNDHVSFLHRIIDDVEHGVEGAEAALVRVFRRVFPQQAA